ncbi:tail length tape measure protein [Gordonia phage Clawz]|uniref:Tape measure protein n=1 Tax=Gordonia phage Clawz TaxID=2743910 RepID=A0AAE7F8U6_9CAUD|nr:tail length tape measure protein [Gordonia phage Clawz]QKY79968.1 tape measure protein [Gordonia phage Clawz]
MASPSATASVRVEADGDDFGPELERIIDRALDAVVRAAGDMAGDVSQSAQQAGNSIADAAADGASQAASALNGIGDDAARAGNAMGAGVEEGARRASRAAQGAADNIGDLGEAGRRAGSQAGDGIGDGGEQGGNRFRSAISAAAQAAQRALDSVADQSVLPERLANLGRSAAGKLAGALKTGLAGVGISVGAGLAATLGAGLNRLVTIDTARTKLKALGNSAQDVEAIMKNANAAVKGTSYGMGDAATIAASAVAAGIKPGQQLEKYLRMTADAASIAGVELGDMGSIMNQVQTNGVAMTDSIQQLADRGLPVFQWLTDATGKSGEELQKFISDGNVSAKMFQDVISKNLGGAAVEMGQSVAGGFANMKAAMGRFGAALIGPFFSQSGSVLNSITGMFDNMTTGATAAMTRVNDYIMGTLIPGVGSAITQFREFGQSSGMFDRIRDIFSQLLGIGRELFPALGQIAGSLGKASGAIGISSFQILLMILQALLPIISILVGWLANLAGVMERNQGVVTVLVGVYTGWRLAILAAKAAQMGIAVWTGIVTGLQGRSSLAIAGNTTAITANSIAARASMAAQKAWAVVQAVFSASMWRQVGATIAATTAWITQRSVMVAGAVATGIMTAAQWALNSALLANPITWIVVLIIGLIAVIVLIATKTTWFQTAWNACWEGIKTATSWAWDNVLKPIFDAFMAAIQWIGDAAVWLWQNAIQPAFDGIATVVGWWWTGVQIYFNAFKTALSWIGDAATWLWQNVMIPVWNGILAVVRFFWSGVQVIIGWIVGGWNRVAAGARIMWSGLSNVFNTVKNAITGVASWIGDKVGAIWGFFSGLPGKIRSIAGNIFAPIKDAGKSVFNAIARLWNNTLGKISFKVPSWVPGVGGKGFSFPKIPEMRRGGLLPGGSHKDRDDIPLLGAKGEFMVRADAVEKYGLAFMEALNRGELPVGGYATGGEIGAAASTATFSGTSGGDPAEQMVALLQQIVANTAAGGTGGGTVAGSVGGDIGSTAAEGAAAVGEGWQTAADSLTGIATGQIDPTMQGLQQGVLSYGLNTQTQLTTVVNPAWMNAALNLVTQKTTMMDPAMLGIQTMTNATSQNTADKVYGQMNPAWQQMGANVAAVHNGTVNPVLANMRGAVDHTAAAFGFGASNIANQWNRVREATASPVRFAIGAVFNDGIVGMWNSVSDLLGTTKMHPYPIRFATGGSVPGSGNGDTVPALLTPKEFVVPRSMAAAIGGGNLDRGLGMLDSVRRRGPTPGLGAEGLFSAVAGRYAGGGPVKGSPAWNAVKRGMGFAARYNGRPYVWGGSLGPNGGTDCSGYMSSIADVILGGSGMYRKWATGAFPGGGGAQGRSVNAGGQLWQAGLRAGMSIGVSTVHTAGTLGGFAGLPAVNVESGGSHGNVAYGGPAVGADNSQFPSRYHLPIVNEMFISGGGGGGGQDMGSLVGAITGDAWRKIMATATGWKGGGYIGEYPGKLATKMKAVTQAKIDKLLEEMMADPGGAGAERWRPMAMRAMMRVGFNARDKRQVDAMISQIQSESGGNPGIAQQITDVNGSGESAGVGLLQIIPSTFAAFRDPALPNDRRNPFANMVAALRYYKSRYGMDLTQVWGHGHGYDLGGLATKEGLLPKHINVPERVLSPAQTKAFEAWMDAGGFSGDTIVMADDNLSDLSSRIMDEMRRQGFSDAADYTFTPDGRTTSGGRTTVMVNQYIEGGDPRETADEVERRLLSLI